MSELALFLTVKAQPGKRDALKELWEEHLKPRATNNPHQTHYVYAYDAQDENIIRISEVYATAAAFEENSGAEWFAEYMKLAIPLLDGEPEFHMAIPQWVKPT